MNTCDRCKKEIYDFERGLAYPFPERPNETDDMQVRASKLMINNLWGWRWHHENKELPAGHGPWKTEEHMQVLSQALTILQMAGVLSYDKADAISHNLCSNELKDVRKHFTRKELK